MKRYHIMIASGDSVHGIATSNPLEAVKTFARYLIGKRTLPEENDEVMFHELGMAVITCDTPYLTHAIIWKDIKGEPHVEMHARSTDDDMLEEMRKYETLYNACKANNTGYAVHTAAVISFETAEMVCAFDDGRAYDLRSNKL